MSLRLCSFDTVPDVFSPAECDRILELGRALELKDAETHTDSGGRQVDIRGRNCLIEWIERGGEDWAWVFERIDQAGLALNEKRWRFDLVPSHSIQYTAYGFGQFYGAHFDNGSKETQHRKLSISVQLTDPSSYVGGALRFWSMNAPQTAPKARGGMTVFPSYLMHVAKPVWWGRREVLVTWLDGKKTLR